MRLRCLDNHAEIPQLGPKAAFGLVRAQGQREEVAIICNTTHTQSLSHLQSHSLFSIVCGEPP
jgi:hypothetical protein